MAYAVSREGGNDNTVKILFKRNRNIWNEYQRPLPLHSVRKNGRGRAEKIFESLETTARKSSIYGKVTIAKKISIKTVRFRERLR
jgi:hypothetical protein